MKATTPLSALFFAALLGLAENSLAGGVIDKIYHPYVNPMEQELEWRGIFQDHQPFTADNIQRHRFAYGRSLSDRLFAEAYLIGEKSSNDSFDIEAYELEFIWQLTEQGEYWADWGLLLELEKKANLDQWELISGGLVEKEWGRWSGTANFIVVNRWGADSIDDTEARFSLQTRFRYSKAFEPAVEFYSGQDTLGLGPAFKGKVRLANRKTLNWEAGVIFGLDRSSPNRTLRLLLDLEF